MAFVGGKLHKLQRHTNQARGFFGKRTGIYITPMRICAHGREEPNGEGFVPNVGSQFGSGWQWKVWQADNRLSHCFTELFDNDSMSRVTSCLVFFFCILHYLLYLLLCKTLCHIMTCSVSHLTPNWTLTSFSFLLCLFLLPSFNSADGNSWQVSIFLCLFKLFFKLVYDFHPVS